MLQNILYVTCLEQELCRKLKKRLKNWRILRSRLYLTALKDPCPLPILGHLITLSPAHPGFLTLSRIQLRSISCTSWRYQTCAETRGPPTAEGFRVVAAAGKGCSPLILSTCLSLLSCEGSVWPRGGQSAGVCVDMSYSTSRFCWNENSDESIDLFRESLSLWFNPLCLHDDTQGGCSCSRGEFMNLSVGEGSSHLVLTSLRTLLISWLPLIKYLIF